LSRNQLASNSPSGKRSYSITSSARAGSVGGIRRSSALSHLLPEQHDYASTLRHRHQEEIAPDRSAQTDRAQHLAGVKPEAMAMLAMSVLLEVADNHRHRAEQIGG
jgi:hypothetical protein